MHCKGAANAGQIYSQSAIGILIPPQALTFWKISLNMLRLGETGEKWVEGRRLYCYSKCQCLLNSF